MKTKFTMKLSGQDTLLKCKSTTMTGAKREATKRFAEERKMYPDNPGLGILDDIFVYGSNGENAINVYGSWVTFRK